MGAAAFSRRTVGKKCLAPWHLQSTTKTILFVGYLAIVDSQTQREASNMMVLVVSSSD